jgi:hypothetical protein
MSASSLATSWQEFKQRYNIFALATGCTSKPEETTLLAQEAVDTYSTFTRGSNKKTKITTGTSTCM